ncbi:hypothetical protein CKAN_01518200 [Cinnamomum micranthum f. kanehirae]|uniref:Uncharacterized protein n=1 Tax=Cinnamomum micranthum f. kanehirae TaxID=337451 RepID=A0A443P689_9MAGN|nr:hypothetical protein CKAN_01518200 [Cinnamomum micranthum f. kanehirae]
MVDSEPELLRRRWNRIRTRNRLGTAIRTLHFCAHTYNTSHTIARALACARKTRLSASPVPTHRRAQVTVIDHSHFHFCSPST